MKKLYHYHNEYIKELDRTRKYDNSFPPAFADKPAGLWMSCNGEEGWESWCREQDFDVHGLRYKYSVTLNENANIVQITSLKKLHEFTLKYHLKNKRYQSEVYPYFKEAGACLTYRCIDWKKVSEDYQGIYLETYGCNYWLKYSWIYGWDCISACIWDLSSIKDFTLKKQLE